jgi:nucleotide-binding universal stress UspA family protein
LFHISHENGLEEGMAMIAFKKILLTTDLSPSAASVTPYAVELARKFDGTVHLVNVFEDTVYYASAMADAPLEFAAWIAESHAIRERELAGLAVELAATHGVKVEPVLLRGHAAAGIVKHAQDIQADCIVIATHGRTGFSHLLFGSVAEKVVRLSACPVLTVRPKTGQTAT